MVLLLLTTPFNIMNRKSRRHGNSSRIKRGHSSLQPRPNFYIFCEGKRTEPDYFRALKDSLTPKSNVNLEFPYVGAVPHTIATHAVELNKSISRSQKRVRSFNKNDQVWAVFDRDTHEKFDEAVKLCNANGVCIGRSNRWFEVWLILHIQDHDKPDNAQDVKKLYQQLLHSKKKWGKRNRYHELVKHVKDAEFRASNQLQRRYRETNEYGDPSTTVGQRTAAIRDTNEKYQEKIR